MSLRVRSYRSFCFGEFKGHPTLEIDSDSWHMHFSFGKSKARLFIANMQAIEQHVNDKAYYKPNLTIKHDGTELILTPDRVRQIYKWRHVISRWLSGGSFKSVQLASGLNQNESEIIKESLHQEYVNRKHSYSCHCSSAFNDRSTAEYNREPREVNFIFNEYSGSLFSKVTEMREFVKTLMRWLPDILDAQSEKNRIQKIHLDKRYAEIAKVNAAIDYYKKLSINKYNHA